MPSQLDIRGFVRTHARVSAWVVTGVGSVLTLLLASAATGGSATELPPLPSTATHTPTVTTTATASPTATATGTATASATATMTAVPPTATPAPPTARPAQPQPAPPTATAIPPSPPPPPPAAPPAAASLAPMAMDAYARALLDATNARRASVGVAPLRENGYLNAIARLRSDEMAQYDYFSHVSPVTGENVFAIMDRHGVRYGWAGENLAMNNYPEAECVAVADQALWESPAHHKNIVNPEYTDAGIALAVDATGMKYFTVVFAGPP